MATQDIPQPKTQGEINKENENHHDTPQTVKSPIIEETMETMDFYAALKEVMKGKIIHKLEWQDRQEYGFLQDGWLMLHRADGKFYKWTLNDGDINGRDYIVLT